MDRVQPRVVTGTRQLRRYRVWPGALLGFRPGNVFECDGSLVPEGAHIDSVSVGMPTAGGHHIDVIVSHSEFDEVPEGSEIPLFDGPTFRQVKR